jgi:hypothetical protein
MMKLRLEEGYGTVELLLMMLAILSVLVWTKEYSKRMERKLDEEFIKSVNELLLTKEKENL